MLCTCVAEIARDLATGSCTETGVVLLRSGLGLMSTCKPRLRCSCVLWLHTSAEVLRYVRSRAQ